MSRYSVGARRARLEVHLDVVAALAFAVVVEGEIVFGVMRHDSWLRSGASAIRSFLDGAEHAVLRRAGSQSERLADFFDRSSFVVAQRERGALERAQIAQRVLHAPIDLRALRLAFRVRRCRPPAVPRRLPDPGCRRAPGRAAPASTASDPPSSSRRCDRARCRNWPATRIVRAGDTPVGSFPAPHLRHPARSRSSGTPAGRPAGCASRRARETRRCHPGGHGPGRLLPLSRPSA